MRRCAVLVTALVFDMALGEPPAHLHPVVWLGRVASTVHRLAPKGHAAVEFAGSAILSAVSVGIAILGSLVLQRVLAPLSCASRPLAFAAEAYALKTTLALRALLEAGETVQKALEHNDLPNARAALRSLVSRPTETLDGQLMASAAIESLAENASDSVIAPAMAYMGFGLPGAFVYRTVNTLDAMFGYRGTLEWSGKVPARLDDLANLLPSRLTALLLVIAAVSRGGAKRAWQVLWRDHSRTASPNAGWPMSAMAGALGVELQKPHHYTLGAPAPRPVPSDIAAAAELVRLAVVLGLVLITAWEIPRSVRRT